jgi:hypothetical protein
VLLLLVQEHFPSPTQSFLLVSHILFRQKKTYCQRQIRKRDDTMLTI